ncbi:MAG: hypothetical protein ACQGVC_04140 [Myxococcota bacterium]
MDHKEGFEQRARRAFGPAEQPPERGGPLGSGSDALFERLVQPMAEALPRALEFRRKAGNWFSFPYHCLMSVEYKPHSEIRLRFTTHEVRVVGRDLTGLYQDICAQRCESAAETERAEAFDPEARAIVEAIEIEGKA